MQKHRIFILIAATLSWWGCSLFVDDPVSTSYTSADDASGDTGGNSDDIGGNAGGDDVPGDPATDVRSDVEPDDADLPDTADPQDTSRDDTSEDPTSEPSDAADVGLDVAPDASDTGDAPDAPATCDEALAGMCPTPPMNARPKCYHPVTMMCAWECIGDGIPINGDAANGCQLCTPVERLDAICDSVDNDCSGTADCCEEGEFWHTDASFTDLERPSDVSIASNAARDAFAFGYIKGSSSRVGDFLWGQLGVDGSVLQAPLTISSSKDGYVTFDGTNYVVTTWRFHTPGTNGNRIRIDRIGGVNGPTLTIDTTPTQNVTDNIQHLAVASSLTGETLIAATLTHDVPAEVCAGGVTCIQVTSTQRDVTSRSSYTAASYSVVDQVQIERVAAATSGRSQMLAWGEQTQMGIVRHRLMVYSRPSENAQGANLLEVELNGPLVNPPELLHITDERYILVYSEMEETVTGHLLEHTAEGIVSVGEGSFRFDNPITNLSLTLLEPTRLALVATQLSTGNIAMLTFTPLEIGEPREHLTLAADATWENGIQAIDLAPLGGTRAAIVSAHLDTNASQRGIFLGAIETTDGTWSCTLPELRYDP